VLERFGMAAIDALLRVMTLRDAEAMILVAGQPPRLRRRGHVEAMSMPPLEPAMVAVFVEELVPPSHDLATAAFEVLHTATEGVFPIAVELTPTGHKLSVRARKPPTTATATVTPSATATSTVTVTPTATVTVTPTATATATPTDRIHALVAEAAALDASDLLLSQDLPPRVRVDGDLRSLSDEDPITTADLRSLCGSGEIGSRGSIDLGLSIAGTRLRVNVFRHAGGLGAALRVIRDRAPTLRELGLPEEIDGAIRHHDGLVLVCGPAGSGKSTTLVALIEELDRHRSAHVITLEDPVEYRFRPRRCLIHQRELGEHTASFADGLRAALREAPDVIVVGELRDPETISIALTAAETGHLVIGTLHAPHAVGAIDRMIDGFPDAQQRQARAQLAAALRVIVTQHLVPRRTGGRVVAVEHVPATAAVGNLIRKGDLHLLPTHIQSGRDLGMIPLERNLARLVRASAITAQVARRIAHEPELFEAALRAG
jgi:twitching motility protein PilT